MDLNFFCSCYLSSGIKKFPGGETNILFFIFYKSVYM
jgi:hypothetical protein